MLRRLLVLAWALNCFAIPCALAQDTLHLATIGNWQIRVDKSTNLGCFLVGTYQGGTVLRVGIDARNDTGYIMVGNDAWRSLQEGNRYDLALRFDNAAPWRGRATARRLGGSNMMFLYMTFDHSRFLVEVARRLRLSIFYEGQFVTQLPLRGTHAATLEMLRCQRDANIAREQNRPPRDPFGGGGGGPSQSPPAGGGGGAPSDDPAASSSGPPPGSLGSEPSPAPEPPRGLPPGTFAPVRK